MKSVDTFDFRIYTKVLGLLWVPRRRALVIFNDHRTNIFGAHVFGSYGHSDWIRMVSDVIGYVSCPWTNERLYRKT